MFHEDKELCSLCKGVCCKRMPGCIWPEDINLESLKDLLCSRDYVFDFWEGDPRPNKKRIQRGYYLRPAIIDRRDSFVDASWGGQCVFLNHNGCMLEAKDRPRECRDLVPAFKDGKPACTIANEESCKRHCAIAWIPYHKAIESLLQELRGW